MERLDVLLIRRVFAQLRTENRDIIWDEMALGFEYTINVKK